MADQALKQRIFDFLRQSIFTNSDEAVVVTDGEVEPNVHLVVFSPKFDGLDMTQKQDLLWEALESGLSQEEIGYITLLVGVSPEEAKASM